MSYEEGTTIHRSTIELLDKLYKALKQRDQYKAENEKLHKLKDIKENALKGSNFIIENQKATIKRLEEENEKLRKDNLELDDTLSVMSEDYSELSDKNTQLKKDLDFWCDEAHANKKELEHQFEENAELKRQIKEHKEIDEFLNKFNKHLNGTNLELKAEIEQLKEKLNKSDHTIATLIINLEELKHSYKNKIDDMKSLSDENEQLKQELKMAEERINKTLDRKSNIEQKLQNKIDENKMLERLKIENEYLLNVIKMSENIEIHSDVEERVDDEG